MIGFDTVTAHDLLQRLAFQTAESGSLGDIAAAFGKKKLKTELSLPPGASGRKNRNVIWE